MMFFFFSLSLSLSLSDNGFEVEGGKMINEMLRTNSTLTAIELNCMGSVDVNIWSQQLNAINLDSYWNWRWRIKFDWWNSENKYFVDSYKCWVYDFGANSPHLHLFWLWTFIVNVLQDKGVVGIFEALKENTTLTSLNVECRIIFMVECERLILFFYLYSEPY